MTFQLAPQWLPPGRTDAPEEYWREVERLGIHDLVRLADGPDFIGITAAGDYIRVPNPPRHHEQELGFALYKLTARCQKWYS